MDKEERKAYNKEYRLKNKLKIKEKSRLYYIENKEKMDSYSKEKFGSEYFKEYYIKNKQKQNDFYSKNRKAKIDYSKNYYLQNKVNIIKINAEYINKKRNEDNVFKLNKNISCLIRKTIRKRGFVKKSKTIDILGCSICFFKDYLESKFLEGMRWDNQGEWHLDHIHPSSLAKDESELIRLNHYTNFQPLWAIDNIRKGNRIIN